MSDQCDAGISLMDRLKESTRSMHDSAEGSQFQGLLAKGMLSESAYADYLAQLYLVHSTLEKEIRRRADSKNGFDKIVSNEQLQEPFLKADLERFGRKVEDIKPLPSTQRLLRLLENYSEACPPALLGMHYVLLGSKHGGKFIAKTCSETYNLQDGKGVMYFDPYGQNFMPIWKAFKEEMNQLELNEKDREKVCAAAGVMFMAVTEIGGELMPVTSK